MIFVSDGASWCLNLMEENFPGSTYVLDFWHLAKNIKVCLGAGRKESVGKLLDLAARGETEEMTSRLWLLFSSSRDPTWRARLLDFIKFIEKNAKRRKNAAKLNFLVQGRLRRPLKRFAPS